MSKITTAMLKTGLSHTKLSNMMDSETWFSAKKAVEFGFADGMMFAETSETAEAVMWNRFSMSTAAVNAMRRKLPSKSPTGTSVKSLYQRLSLIKPN